MKCFSKFFLIGMLVFAPQVLTIAHAERADRRKPMVVNAGDFSGDNKAKTLQLRKGVNITQGTLKIVGDEGEVQGEPPSSVAKLTGGPVCFRQKKDNSDDIMRGQAQRIEYDQGKEKVEFFDKVIVHDGPNEMRGDHVIYYMNTEKFEVRDKTAGNVRIVMVPKEAAEDATKPQSTEPQKPRLKSSKEIEAGRYEPLASKCIKEAL